MNHNLDTMDDTNILSLASITASYYLQSAVDHIDKEFGEGYAKQHPELVGVFMRVASEDFVNSMKLKYNKDYVKTYERKIVND